MNQSTNCIKQAIAAVSETNIYQHRLLKIIFAYLGFAVISILINPIVFSNPLLICQSISDQPLHENKACSILSDGQCKYINDYTGTYTGRLFCEFAYSRIMIQSLLGIGSIFGKFCVGFLADMKGRIYSVKFFLILGFIAAFLDFYGIYYRNIGIIYVGQFLLGCGYSAMTSLNSLIIAQIYVGDPNENKKILSFVFVFWGFWQVIVGAFAIGEFPWQYYIMILLIGCIVCSYWQVKSLMIESPLYYYSVVQDIEATKQNITKLAIINHASPQRLEYALGLIQPYHNKQYTKHTLVQVYENLLSNSNNLKILACLGTIHILWTMQYIVQLIMLERFVFGTSVTLFIIGLSEVLFYYWTSKIIGKHPSHKHLSIGALAMGLLGMLLCFKQIAYSTVICLIVMFLLNGAIAFQNAIWYTMPFQLFSTQYTSFAFMILTSFGNLGRFLSPYFVYVVQSFEMNALGVISIFVIILNFMPSLYLGSLLKNNDKQNCSKIQQLLVPEKKRKSLIQTNTTIQAIKIRSSMME